jgi:hypothetical protein
VNLLDRAIEAAGGPGKARVVAVADGLGLTEQHARRRLKSDKRYRYEDGVIYATEKGCAK